MKLSDEYFNSHYRQCPGCHAWQSRGYSDCPKCGQTLGAPEYRSHKSEITEPMMEIIGDEWISVADISDALSDMGFKTSIAGIHAILRYNYAKDRIEKRSIKTRDREHSCRIIQVRRKGGQA